MLITRASPPCIGCVEIVNGSAAREVPEFLPTRHELLELVKYWESTFLDRAFFMFQTRQIGSTDIRMGPFAERRVIRIIKLLGDEGIKAVRKVREEFEKSIGVREAEPTRSSRFWWQSRTTLPSFASCRVLSLPSRIAMSPWY